LPGRTAALIARQFSASLVPFALAAALGGLVTVGGARLLASSAFRTSPITGAAPAGVSPWITPRGPTHEALGLLAVLRRAGDDGLDPGRYRLAEIERDLASLDDSAALARADRLLTQAYLDYARDLRVPRQGAAFTYVDNELAPAPGDARQLLATAAPVEQLRQLQRANPLYDDLRTGLERYRARWAGLPRVAIPAGAPLAIGSRGERVVLLRRRLGLPAGSDAFDEQLGEAVSAFREAHGLAARPIADGATIAALNRGASYYERLIAANLDRLRALPDDGRRYILVDAAAAELRMIEGGRQVGTMRVIVGKPGMETPQLAGLIRFALFNPYWNVPPDLVRRSIAPHVLREGIGYLDAHRYVLFTDWTPSAASVDPAVVDWQAVADGRQKLWVRQLPGQDNMMGTVKFMLPNRLGIYLHDTPRKADFARNDRRLSSGCVRVEDAHRLARWIFGGEPPGEDDATPDRRVDVPQPVPVYITYLTAVLDAGGVRFAKDVYHRDRALPGATG
jgi:murein L,D-transpeptidase YcbB/YkuD